MNDIYITSSASASPAPTSPQHEVHPYPTVLRLWSNLTCGSIRPMGVASQNSTLPCAITTFPVSLPSLLLAMSSRVYVFFSPRGHEPSPTLRDRLNSYLSLQRHRFPIPRYAKRPDVTLFAIGPLFLLPITFSPHCTLKVSQHDSLWQPPTAHSDERPRARKVFSCATLSEVHAWQLCKCT